MSDNQNNPKQECKCDKKVKALEKQIAELGKKVETIEKQLITFRKVLTK